MRRQPTLVETPANRGTLKCDFRSTTEEAEMADRAYHVMSRGGGSHTTYARGHDLFVEWYDHGDQVPYESANLLIFGPVEMAQLLSAAGLPNAVADEAAKSIASRFRSYFEVKDFALAHAIPFKAEVDFHP